MNPFKYIGRRIMKTGLAVFITAFICIKLDLPVIFAVITAIVTTEPTAKDSLKKGMIRLPAAAIGASFALIFDLFLGHSAITFTLVSMFTILFCNQFKLDNGTLVATLTAVAMIPGSHEGLFHEFLLRLSGTSLGIVISTLVNFAVLPPKFGPMLVQKVNELYDDTACHLENLIKSIVNDEEKDTYLRFRNLYKQLDKAFQLCEYQEAEWQYRKSCKLEERSFHFLKKKLTQLQSIFFHVGNLNNVSITNQLSKEEKELVLTSAKFMNNLCKNILSEHKKDIYDTQRKLYDLLKKEINNKTMFSPKEAFLYELLAILDCLVNLQVATKEEQLFSKDNDNYPTYIFANPLQAE